MPEWSLLQFASAGTPMLLLLVIGALWRLERRVYRLELVIKERQREPLY